MPTTFEVALSGGETLKGYFWSSGEPKKNLVILTGMNEYALRYNDLASFFNKKGINVYVLDAFGQGLNAKSVEEQEQWPLDGFSKNVDAANVLVNKIKKDNKLPVCLMGHSMGSFHGPKLCGTLSPHRGTGDSLRIQWPSASQDEDGVCLKQTHRP
jgi:alpha-beta hydrolase superfamily lysophospholipase